MWRYGNLDQEWRHFGFATVSFGDKPAGVYLDIVINQAADRFHHIDPVAAVKIKKDRYVEVCIVSGGSMSEVERMAGNRGDPESKFKTDGTLTALLYIKVPYSLKQWLLQEKKTKKC